MTPLWKSWLRRKYDDTTGRGESEIASDLFRRHSGNIPREHQKPRDRNPKDPVIPPEYQDDKETAKRRKEFFSGSYLKDNPEANRNFTLHYLRTHPKEKSIIDWKSWLIWKKDDKEEDFENYWDKQKVPDDDDKIIYEGDEEEPESSYELPDYEEEEESVEKASLFKSLEGKRNKTHMNEVYEEEADEGDDPDDINEEDRPCPTCGIKARHHDVMEHREKIPHYGKSPTIDDAWEDEEDWRRENKSSQAQMEEGTQRRQGSTMSYGDPPPRKPPRMDTGSRDTPPPDDDDKDDNKPMSDEAWKKIQDERHAEEKKESEKLEAIRAERIRKEPSSNNNDDDDDEVAEYADESDDDDDWGSGTQDDDDDNTCPTCGRHD